MLHASVVEEEKGTSSMARKQAVETLDASRLPQKQPSCSSEEKTPWYKTLVSETTTNKPLGSKAGELILETRLSSRRGQGKDTTLITRGQKKQARRRGRIGSWLRTKRKEESAVSSFPTQDDDRGGWETREESTEKTERALERKREGEDSVRSGIGMGMPWRSGESEPASAEMHAYKLENRDAFDRRRPCSTLSARIPQPNHQELCIALHICDSTT